MAVIGYDPLLPREAIQQRGAEPVTLDELYARADFISLHLPLTAETRGMVGQQVLERVKPGVRLVCTARGGLIDEEALLGALDTGRVAGAALDVFAEEPPGATRLVRHPQIIATRTWRRRRWKRRSGRQWTLLMKCCQPCAASRCAGE